MEHVKFPKNFGFTYKERYLLEATFMLMLIYGKNEKKEFIYAYLGIKAKLLEGLCREINSNKIIDLLIYGKVFFSGKGEEPSDEHCKLMEDTYFFNHDKINVGILNGPGVRTGGSSNRDTQIFIRDIQRIKIGVISTQSICLDDAITIANKIHAVDTENSEMIFYKQPEEGYDE